MKPGNKNRILVIPSWYPPDGGSFFRDHAIALNQGDFNVHVVFTRFMSFSENPIRKILSSLKCHTEWDHGVLTRRIGFFKIPFLTRLSVLLWKWVYTIQVERYIKEYGIPDIMIAHSAMWAGLVASAISAKHSIPFLVVEHRSILVKGNSFNRNRIKNWENKWLRKVYHKASGIIPVGRSLIPAIQSLIPGEEKKIMVIPNMIGPAFLPEAEIKDYTDSFTFISFGVLENRKGYKYLIEAFREFINHFEGNFFLKIGGKGSRESELRKLAEDLEIADKVIFLGWLDKSDVRKELENAQVFILPSLSESFGVVLIEAMATGLPVISTFSGGPESIINPSNGLLVNPANISELEEAMSDIYINFRKYDRQKIRYDVIVKYGPAEITFQYHHLIKEILHE